MILPNFTYSTKSKRYHNTDNGTFVGRVEVRQELDRLIDQSIVRIESTSRELLSGDVSLSEWQDSIASEIKPLHMIMAATAKGGWNEMSQNDWDRVSERLKEQYQYLQNFANEVFIGSQTMSNMLVARSTLYAEAARATYENERRLLEIESGSTEEMNILGGADHCVGCSDATAAGWVPIDTLPPIGSRECVSRCRCTMIYRNGPTDKVGSDITS